MRTASSSAWSLDSRLIDRFAERRSPAPRARRRRSSRRGAGAARAAARIRAGGREHGSRGECSPVRSSSRPSWEDSGREVACAARAPVRWRTGAEWAVWAGCAADRDRRRRCGRPRRPPAVSLPRGRRGRLRRRPRRRRTAQAPAAKGRTTSVPADEPAQFVAAVVANVQQTWKQIFERAGRTYESTRLVLFDAPTQTGCGVGSPATGPFYCPPTIGSTSTSASSASCRNGSARRATSRRRT